jgi:hypothetical protein
MKIDNVSQDSLTGEMTSRIAGFTFTHTGGCALYTKKWGSDWLSSCDCVLSRVEITEINGVPVPCDPSVLSDEQLKTKFWHKEYTDLRRRFTYMSAVAVAGWLYGLARGIWGF